MRERSPLYLAAIPGDTRRAQSSGLALAHMAYRIGGDMTLLRDLIGSDMRGGIMVVTHTPSELRDGSILQLCKEIVTECQIRGFEGLLLDFEGPVRHLLTRIAEEADAMCYKNGLSLIVGENYIESTQYAAVAFSSGLVSGSLRQKLEYYISRFGAERVVLEIERLSQDIVLPAPQGRGVTLTRTQLSQLLVERRPSVFFSHELCAHYFTYKDSSGITHFIIYDDAISIHRKLEQARMLGLRCALMLFAEVYDMLGELRSFW